MLLLVKKLDYFTLIHCGVVIIFLRKDQMTNTEDTNNIHK